MRLFLSLLFAGFSVSLLHAEERGVRFATAENFLPKLKEIVLVKAGEPGPGAAKHKAAYTIAKYGEDLNLKEEGPFDIWWVPQNGLPIRVTAQMKFADNQMRAIKLDDYVGIVTVRGDRLARPELVTITSQDDVGPDEKGHLPVQTAKEFKVDMVVPDGFYALWVSPDSGARAKKVTDRFRVLAGKSTALD